MTDRDGYLLRIGDTVIVCPGSPRQEIGHVIRFDREFIRVKSKSWPDGGWMPENILYDNSDMAMDEGL